MREGTYVYLWLIHVDIWQKPTKFCKAIILQLKKIKLKERKKYIWHSKNIYGPHQESPGKFETSCNVCCKIIWHH